MSTSIEQRRISLAKAAATKRERAQIRHAVERGELHVADVLEHDACQTLSLHDLLCWQHGWGGARAIDLLDRLRIGYYRTCGELTARQHGLVAEATR